MSERKRRVQTNIPARLYQRFIRAACLEAMTKGQAVAAALLAWVRRIEGKHRDKD